MNGFFQQLNKLRCVFRDVSRETWWFVWGGCCGFVGWDHVALVVG